MEKLKAQEGEGCHMWGTLAVNKVCILTPSCSPVPTGTLRKRACCRASSALRAICRFQGSRYGVSSAWLACWALVGIQVIWDI